MKTREVPICDKCDRAIEGPHFLVTGEVRIEGGAFAVSESIGSRFHQGTLVRSGVYHDDCLARALLMRGAAA